MFFLYDYLNLNYIYIYFKPLYNLDLKCPHKNKMLLYSIFMKFITFIWIPKCAGTTISSHFNLHL